MNVGRHSWAGSVLIRAHRCPSHFSGCGDVDSSSSCTQSRISPRLHRWSNSGLFWSGYGARGPSVLRLARFLRLRGAGARGEIEIYDTYRTCPVQLFGDVGTNLGRAAGRDLLPRAHFFRLRGTGASSGHPLFGSTSRPSGQASKFIPHNVFLTSFCKSLLPQNPSTYS